MLFYSFFQKSRFLHVFFCVFFMPSVVFALPSGYVELEYIAKNNSSQYIQTNYVGNLNSRYEGAVYVAALPSEYDAYIIASRQSSGNSRHIALGVVRDATLTGPGLYVGHGNYVTQGNRLGGVFDKRMDFVTDFPNRTYSVSIDGGATTTKAIQSSAIVTSFTNTAPLQIFFNRVAGTSSAASYAAPISARIYYLKIYENNNLVHHFVPAKRSSDNEIGMYDTVSGTFFTNSGTGSFTAGLLPLPEHCVSGSVGTCTECESGYVLNNGACTKPIKIATTAYNSARFSPVVTDLNSTIATIRDVVTNTITQTGQIATLQAEKQTRPNETCRAGKKCLLVTDENGTPHWYEIIEPAPAFNAVEFLNLLKNTNGNNEYFKGNTTTYNELGKSGSVFTVQPSASSGLRQLNETEWAVKWNDKGAVYGTSVCNGKSGTIGVASSTEQTETKGLKCWCKMTSVVDFDGVEHDVSRAPWVFRDTFFSAADCAYYCAYYCASHVRAQASFRPAVFGVGN